MSGPRQLSPERGLGSQLPRAGVSALPPLTCVRLSKWPNLAKGLFPCLWKEYKETAYAQGFRED